MAREYARLATQIWRDPDFRALPSAAQRTYMQLISQADISAAGVLPMTVKRWASAASDTTEESVTLAIKELHEARFVVADFEAEEVLVRTFTKWDGGSNNPKRRIAIIAAAKAITSRAIGWALSREFARLELPTDGLPDSPSDTPSHSPRVVVKASSKGTATHNPETTTRNPQPVPPPAGNAVALRDDAIVDAEVVEPPQSAQTLVAEWVDHCRTKPPRNVIGQIAKHVGSLLAEGYDYGDVRRAVQAWQAKGLHPSTLPSVFNELVNAGGPAPNKPRTSTTDERVAQGLDLARKYAEKGE